jgi:hypothetical protein
MEPGLIAGDARCPSTSSWWALDTSSDLGPWRGSGRRPSGGHGGCGGAIGGEIVPQPPSQVFFNTVRLVGHQNSRMWKEVVEGGLTAGRQREELLR